MAPDSDNSPSIQSNTETLLDEDDPILGLPNIKEFSSSSSSTPEWTPHTASSLDSSKNEEENEKNDQKSLSSEVGAAEVEKLLQAIDKKEEEKINNKAKENSSGVSQLLDEALRLIGKVPNTKLREIFDLEKNPPTTVDGQCVPITSDMSCETHFR